jgi:mRNA interferase RelE/StbE
VRSYKLTIGSRAAKELSTLSAVVAQRIDAAILGLSSDPRPHGAKKLKGGRQLWRIRVGDYRIVYSIDNDQAVVDVIGVPHRSKAYR